MGVFNIGLSIMPNNCLKLLDIIGVCPNKNIGLENLNKCKELNSLRSKYANALILLYYTEMNPC